MTQRTSAAPLPLKASVMCEWLSVCERDLIVGTVCLLLFILGWADALMTLIFPDGTLGNDNLWGILSNSIFCVCTQKKSLIINRGELEAPSHSSCGTVPAWKRVACHCFIYDSQPLLTRCKSTV